MSLEDPFFVVKDEVFKALNKTRGLYLRWRELDASSGNVEIEWTTTELRNSLRSIEWDLEDLEDTISIVEKNPSKFRIDDRELSSRRHFTENTHDEVKQMKEKMSLNRNRDRDITAHQPLLDEHNNQQHLQQHYQQHEQYQHNYHSNNHKTHLIDCNGVNSNNNNSISTSGSCVANTIAGTMAAASLRHNSTKYSKLENTVESPGHYCATSSGNQDHQFDRETTNVTQQRMTQDHDEQLKKITDSMGTLRPISRKIGPQLDEQAVMLDDIGANFYTTESTLNSTMKTVAKLLHVNENKRQWLAILVLSTFLLIVMILLIVL